MTILEMMNLDDEAECRGFVSRFGTMKGRALANRLDLHGPGSDRLATDLSNYAWNKLTAINCRLTGKIETAIAYESICDKIYRGSLAGKVGW